MTSIYNSFLVLLLLQLVTIVNSLRSPLASKENCDRCWWGSKMYYCAENDKCVDSTELLQCPKTQRFTATLTAKRCGCVSETTCLGCLNTQHSNKCSWYNYECIDRAHNSDLISAIGERSQCPNYSSSTSSRSSLASSYKCKQCRSKYNNNRYCASSDTCFDTMTSEGYYCPDRFTFHTGGFVSLYDSCECISKNSCDSCVSTSTNDCAWDVSEKECVDKKKNQYRNIKKYSSECNEGLSAGVIVAIVFGVLAFVIGLPIILCVCCGVGCAKAVSNRNVPHQTQIVMSSNPQPTEIMYEKSTHDPTHNQFAPTYVNTKPTYDATGATYANNQPTYANTQPNYPNAQPVYANAQPNYANNQPVYAAHTNVQPAQPAYANAQPAYANAQPAYANAQPGHINSEGMKGYTQPAFAPHANHM